MYSLCRVNNITEGDCLLAGVRYFLEHIPQQDAVEEQAYDVLNAVIDEINEKMKVTSTMDAKSRNKVFMLYGFLS